MKKFPVLCLMALISIGQLSAQSFVEKLKFGVWGGYSFYPQNELKSVNNSMMSSLPFETQVIDNFKPAFYFGSSIQYRLLNHFYLGPSYEYHYAGSRLGSRDYSGQFIFDQYIHTHQFALKMDYQLVSFQKMAISAQASTGGNLSSWKMDSNFELGEDGQLLNEQSTDEYTGFSWHISPAVKCTYEVIPGISLTATVAYAFDIARKYHYKGRKDWKATKSPEWSGLNLSLGLDFQLK